MMLLWLLLGCGAAPTDHGSAGHHEVPHASAHPPGDGEEETEGTHTTDAAGTDAVSSTPTTVVLAPASTGSTPASGAPAAEAPSGSAAATVHGREALAGSDHKEGSKPTASPPPVPVGVETVAIRPPAQPSQVATPRHRRWLGPLSLLLAAAGLLSLGAAAGSVLRVHPHLGREVALVRVGATLLAGGALALGWLAVAPAGGGMVGLGGAIALTVLLFGLVVLRGPAYVDGLAVLLRAALRGTRHLSVDGVEGELGEVGLLRVRLRGPDGHWASLPIGALGGAVVRGVDHDTHPVEVRVGDAAAAAAMRERLVLSPFRDPNHPVAVLTVDCAPGSGEGPSRREEWIVRAVAWGPDARRQLLHALVAPPPS